LVGSRKGDAITSRLSFYAHPVVIWDAVM